MLRMSIYRDGELWNVLYCFSTKYFILFILCFPIMHRPQYLDSSRTNYLELIIRSGMAKDSITMNKLESIGFIAKRKIQTRLCWNINLIILLHHRSSEIKRIVYYWNMPIIRVYFHLGRLCKMNCECCEEEMKVTAKHATMTIGIYYLEWVPWLGLVPILIVSRSA